MSFVVATIVEGHGEVEALPVLLRRLEPSLDYPRPIRVPRTRLVVAETLARYLRLAAANIHDGGGAGAILIVLDADDDCAATLGPGLAEAGATAVGPPVYCVIAVREFEAWFLAGVTDLAVENAESIRGCKERLRHRLGQYRPTVDQPRLASRIEPETAAAHSPSFAKLTRTIEQLRALARSAGSE